MFNKKGVFKNVGKLTGNYLWRSIFFNKVFNVFLITSILKSPTDFCQFYKVFENTFFTEYFWATAFELAWWSKKFNYVSLIFLNLQLNHALPDWSLSFWCNEVHLLMRKMSGVNSGTAIICEWNHREQVLTFFRTSVASEVALQESRGTFFGTFRCILGQLII